MSIFTHDLERIRLFTASVNHIARLYDDGMISLSTLNAAKLDIANAVQVDTSVVDTELSRVQDAWIEWESV